MSADHDDGVRRSWKGCFLFAGVSAIGLYVVAAPRMCGVTEGRVDAYLLEHPRTGFILGLGICLGLMIAVAKGKEMRPTPAVSRLFVVVPAAVIVFEASHSEATSRWLLDHVPRAVYQQLAWAVWAVFTLLTLWAVAPRAVESVKVSRR